MKIIDLLNNIANRKNMPLSFRYEGIIWVLQGGKYYQKVNDEVEFEEWFKGLLFKCLNDEIEIIEEYKKINKIEPLFLNDIVELLGIKTKKYQDEALRKLYEHIRNQDKIINELIDEVNK